MPFYLSLSHYLLLPKHCGRARQNVGKAYALATRSGERTYQAMAEGRWRAAEAELSGALGLLSRIPSARRQAYVTAAECYRQRGQSAWADRRRAEGRARITHLVYVLAGVPRLRESLF